MRELCYIVGPEYHNATVQTFLRRGCGVSARLLARLKRVENGITVMAVFRHIHNHIHRVNRLQIRDPA
jgi:hypothetical protein